MVDIIMTTPVLSNRVLLTKIKKIEKRLTALENRQNAKNYNQMGYEKYTVDTEMDYSGAFESDIEWEDAETTS